MPQLVRRPNRDEGGLGLLLFDRRYKVRATRWRLGDCFFHEQLGFQMLGASIVPFATVIQLAIIDVRTTFTASMDSDPLHP